MLKKSLKIAGIILLSLTAFALLIPILFENHIKNLVKKEINKNLNARVEFRDASLSVFRHFPRVSIRLEEFSIVGIGEFEKDTLLTARSIDAAVNIMSVISGKDIRVSGVYLDSPRIMAHINKEGKANWEITKEDEIKASADTSTPAFQMTLKKYEIRNGYIKYYDESTGMHAELAGINHVGTGNFTRDVFTLSTRTNTETANFTYASIPYLVDTRTGIKADIRVDNSNNRYTFKTDDIMVNNLKLSAEGFFQLLNDSTYFMDIRFNSAGNEFREILSLVPAIYKNDFEKVQTSGTAVMDGFVKGIYSPDQIPAYELNLRITDGYFKYQDLPKPVKNIQLAMQLSNPDGKPDNTVVNIKEGHVEVDNEPFDFRFLYKHPESAKFIDGAVKGRFDLSQIQHFMKLEKGTKIGGLLWADAFFRGSLASFENAGQFSAGGFFDFRSLFYASKQFKQPVQNGNFKLQVVSTGNTDRMSINVSSGHLEIGKDPVDFTFQLRNPATTMDFNGSVKGKYTLDNLAQFVALEPGSSITGRMGADLAFSANKEIISKGQYELINMSGSTSLSDVKYVSKEYPSGIMINTMQMNLLPGSAVLHSLTGNYLNSRFRANGVLNNLVEYWLGRKPLEGKLAVSVDRMILNDWMGDDSASVSSSGSASSSPFLVPANVDLELDAKAKQVKYDKVNYNNIAGTVLIREETIRLEDVKADALDGTIMMNGTYSTKANKQAPEVYLAYDIKGLDVQKTFYSFNSVQALMPVGQFLSGKISSEMAMIGTLDGNMMPVLSTLSGKGNFLLLNGVLKKFAPLEKIASTLQIEALKEITIKDMRNSYELSSGRVSVRPFTLRVKDIEMEIAGMHGLDRSMDYIVAMKLPRKYMGAQGNTLVNEMAAKANSKGIPIKLGETVELGIKLSGSVANPSIAINFKDIAGDAMEDLTGQATEFVLDKVDSVKNEVRDSLNSAKRQLTTEAKQAAKQEIKNQLPGPDSSRKTPDSPRKKPVEAMKNTVKGLLRKN